MPNRMTAKGIFMNGILDENPTFRLVLGTCPTLAVTTAAINGISMGAAATFVLVGSNVVISLLRNFIPDKVRIPAFIIIICAFNIVIEMLMQAFTPELHQTLGIFLPLIVVNCIILARAEAFASKNSVRFSAIDGLGMGAGFTLAITLIGMIRELLGSGAVFGIQVMNAEFEPMLIMVLAPGGFIVFGIVLGVVNAMINRSARKKGEKEAAA